MRPPFVTERDERDYFAAEVAHARAEIETLETEVARLLEALRLARRGIPDPMHPGIPPQFVDGLVCAGIVMDAALGDDDPGDVEAAREALWERA